MLCISHNDNVWQKPNCPKSSSFQNLYTFTWWVKLFSLFFKLRPVWTLCHYQVLPTVITITLTTQPHHHLQYHRMVKLICILIIPSIFIIIITSITMLPQVAPHHILTTQHQLIILITTVITILAPLFTTYQLVQWHQHRLQILY